MKTVLLGKGVSLRSFTSFRIPNRCWRLVLSSMLFGATLFGALPSCFGLREESYEIIERSRFKPPVWSMQKEGAALFSEDRARMVKVFSDIREIKEGLTQARVESIEAMKNLDPEVLPSACKVDEKWKSNIQVFDIYYEKYTKPKVFGSFYRVYVLVGLDPVPSKANDKKKALCG